MRQFILPEPGDPDSPVILDKKDTHYLKNVLRCKPGRVFSVMDRSGRSWKAVIERFEGASAVIRLAGEGPAGEGTEATTAADAADAESTAGCTTGCASGNTEGIDKAGYSGSAPKYFPGDAPGKKVKLPEIRLFQSLLKGKKMDLVIRQAAEAGVSAVIPVQSRYSIAKLDSESAEGRRERWKKICREALQQSGSKIFPEIFLPVSLEQAVLDLCGPGHGKSGGEREKKQTSLFFHEKDIENKSLHQYLFPVTDVINIFIGPEGGFSGEETAFLEENSCMPASLGENILRAETAALYSVAAVKTILLEKDRWTLC